MDCRLVLVLIGLHLLIIFAKERLFIIETYQEMRSCGTILKRRVGIDALK